jgi:O-antigen/teichoic acid export membrane protein
LTVGKNYLPIAERGKLVAISIATEVSVTVILNLFLLPAWGLFGAVFATMVAHLAALMCLWQAMSRHGYPLDRWTFFVTILPATMLADPMVSVSCIGAVCLFVSDAKRWIRDEID